MVLFVPGVKLKKSCGGELEAELASDPSPPRWNRYRSRKRENSRALFGRAAALAKLIVAGLSGPPPRLVASLSGLESTLLTVEDVELALPSRRNCPRTARAVVSDVRERAGEIMPLPSIGDSGTLGGGLRNARPACIGGEGAGESSGVVNGDM